MSKEIVTKLDPETTRVLPPPGDGVWNPYEKREGRWYEVNPNDPSYAIGVSEDEILGFINRIGFTEVK